MGRIIIIVILSSFLVGRSDGQTSTGLNPIAGFSIYTIRDEADLNSGSVHPALQVGFDVPVQFDTWLFNPGFHYYRMAILPETFRIDRILSNRADIHYVRMPFSFGKMFEIGSFLQIVPMAGMDMHFFLSADENDSNLSNTDLYSFRAGGHLGTQLRLIERITLDMFYQVGLMPAFKARKRSRIDGFSFALGFLI